MPGTAAGNFVTTTTRDRFFTKAVDNIFTGNLLFSRLRSRARPWSGGHRLRITTTVTDRNTATSFAGFDSLDTSQSDVRAQFTIDPSEYANQVVFSGIQLATNKGPEAYLSLIAEEFADAARDLSETLGGDMYLDGTGNSNKAIAGLNYHIDDATDVATYQGLSRNTYTNLRATRNAQSGALTIANLASDYDACQRGSDAPTLIITTPAVFTIIEALLTPTLRFGYDAPRSGTATGQAIGAGTTLAFGANSIYYRGVPVIADEMCTASNIWFINENHLMLYELDYPSEFVQASKEGFGWTGWKRSINQNALVGHLLFAGQLVGMSPRTMSRRTAVTS